MNQPPLDHKESERLEALKSYHILDTLYEAEYDRFTQLASLICNTPISLITLLDENRQWFKSKTGLELAETPRAYAFCDYAIQRPNTSFEVTDALTDPRFAANPLVTGEPNIRFYAGFPLTDPDGFALGTLCVIDRKPGKLTENQLKALQLLAEEVMSLILEKRENEKLQNFEKLFKYSNDLICITGTDGYFKKINPAFSDLLGWGEDYLLQNPFFALVHPDDRLSTEQEIAKLASGENALNFTNRFLTNSGNYKLLQWTATPEPSTGLLFAIARNITDEKNNEEKIRVSENKFRSFFENSQGLMCTHDLQGKFLTVNKSGASLLGYTTEEVLQMSLFDIVPPKHHTELQYYLHEINTKGKSNGLMTTLHKDGSIRVWLYNNTTEKNLDGTQYVIGNSIDITERMQLEHDLNKTRQRLEQTNNIAKVGAWEMILDKQIIFWSSITKEIHEVEVAYEPVMFAGIAFYKEGEHRDRISQAINEAITKGTSWDLELQMITAKGTEKWVRTQGKAEMAKGKCKRLYGALMDIDEQKRTKLALEASENKYRAFFDISPVGIAVNRHNDGKFIDGNRALYRMLGYTEEEYRCLTHHDVTPAKYDEDEMKHRISLTIHKRYGPYEKEYIHKDGHIVPVLLNGIRFTATNGEEHVYSVIQDISERKLSEKAVVVEKSRLSAFVEHAPAAVAMLDLDMIYVAASNRWLEEFGLVGKNVIGLSHYEIVPDTSDEWKAIHQRCLKGAVEKNEEDRWRPKGWDHDQYLRWEVRPWYLFDGSIGGIMMFTQDITEICMQREELETAKQQAEQASIAKSEFLASMSHEIRTPLNGVIGFTDLILKTKLDETQQQYLSIVNQSANALLSIINDILDFSKIEAGKLELEIEKFDLYEIASQAADIISYQVKSKDLEMLLNISTELPRFVWTDAVRLKQVLINLLSNASKFTEQGEIELKIEALTDPTQKDITIRFEVRDTGIGIQADKQKKIFQAFSQEDGSVTRKYGGTGLGLTISNKLLALMGSGLHLKSSPGKGSTFYFDLTLQAEPGKLNQWENISSIKKVLIVDDNENNRTILIQMLLLEQIHADIARNGIEALQILESGKQYDLILMDFNMPIMDGLETIEKIRENFYATAEQQPIMLLSSSSDDDRVIKKCEELDVSLRLVKPIKMQELYRSLSRLARHKDKQELVREEIQSKINLDKIRVLIAEDGEVNMLLAKTIIKRIAPNSMIIEATDGLQAVSACKQQLPDIIFMDIQMPEMNGYEATKHIRALQKNIHIPIIAITAGTVKGEREKCIAAGMDDFISKPIVENTVTQVFSKWFTVIEQNIVQETGTGKKETEHVNFSKLKELVGHDEIAFQGFVELIKNEITNSLKDLEDKFAKQDAIALKSTGHKLKGTALSASLDTLSGIAIRFDKLTEFNESYIASLMEEARKEIAIILGLIQQIL